MSVEHLKAVHMGDLHFENLLWFSSLSFYKDELNVFQKRLEEIYANNSNDELKRNIAHLQHQIVFQREEIDLFRHHISNSEEGLSKFAKEHPLGTDHILFKDHVNMRERMQKFQEVYMGLRTELYRIVSVWI